MQRQLALQLTGDWQRPRSVLWALSVVILASSLDARVRQSASNRKRPTRPAPQIQIDPAAVNDATSVQPIGPDSKGTAVLRAQILLDRANFSPGEIDGNYGRNLSHTVAAFQKARGLPENGIVGAETWQILNQDSAPPLQSYTIAPEEVAGPFEKIPRDMMRKSELRSLGYESALEGLAEKFHCSPKLLTQLNSGKQFDKPGETILAPNVASAPLPKAASILVDGSDSRCQRTGCGWQNTSAFSGQRG